VYKHPHSPEGDAAKVKKEADMKAAADLCKSPSKTSRLVRRKSLTDKQKDIEDALKSPKSKGKDDRTKSPKPRRERRDKSDDQGEPCGETTKTPRSIRRRKTESGDGKTLRNRIRRAKTVDSTLLCINLETDLDHDQAGVGDHKGVSSSPSDPSSGNTSSRLMKNGISF
jgi:hypothetical protein